MFSYKVWRETPDYTNRIEKSKTVILHFEMHKDFHVQFGISLWVQTPKGLSGGFPRWLSFIIVFMCTYAVLFYFYFPPKCIHRCCKQAHTDQCPRCPSSSCFRFSVLLRQMGPQSKAILLPACVHPLHVQLSHNPVRGGPPKPAVLQGIPQMRELCSLSGLFLFLFVVMIVCIFCWVRMRVREGNMDLKLDAFL